MHASEFRSLVPILVGTLVVWALYRPISQIVATLIGQFREVGGGKARFGAAPAFSLAVIVLIVAAIISSGEWPHDAKLVPLTACGMALVAAVLNLVNELFGREQRVFAMPIRACKFRRPIPPPQAGEGWEGETSVCRLMSCAGARPFSLSGWQRSSAWSR